MTTSLSWMLNHNRPVTHLERRQLKHAALRLFKPDYHALSPKDGLVASSHREADFHASLRILHGAALDGSVTPEEWLSASNEVLQSAQIQIEWNKETIFFRAIGSIVEPCRDSEGVFGTLFVLDDEEFWSEVLTPMFGRCGISVRQAKEIKQMSVAISNAPQSNARVIMLDMCFGKRKYQGSDYLRTLNQQFKDIPIIVLSVEDNLSVANLLRREGVFVSISKQISAEERGYRDEVSAFWQLRDAVLLGSFASFSHQFITLFELAIKVHGQAESDIDQSNDALRNYVIQALNAYHQECWGMYSDIWEGTGHARGLSCRQIIRAFGLLNDKWCEFWEKRQFNPDLEPALWVTGADRSSPYRTYHNITTELRNAASHAIVSDDLFEWGDVWVMMLTLFLKLEGLQRTLASPEFFDTFCGILDDQLDACTKSVWGLLHCAGYLDAADPLGGHDILAEELRTELGVLRHQLREFEYKESLGYSAQSEIEALVVRPFLRRHLKDGLLLYEVENPRSPIRSLAQLHADLLLLKLVNTRLNKFRCASGTSPNQKARLGLSA